MTKDPINILLVDDQPAKVLSYEATLQSLGENLIKAGSAREALEHLLKEDIAIVLCDVCMPELDGFELARMIRNHPRFQHTAIIFVSALALTDPDRIKGYSYGAVDYVLVPIVPELLLAKVRVFAEPFFTTKELGKGKGLGLSVVHGLAAQSQGALCLASQVGVGTTAELYFPVGEPGAAEPPRPASLNITVPSRSCRVLLVEDDPMVADTAASMLQCLGHQVLVASSGTEALNILQGEPRIDVVITDHAMPHMTGSELADQTRGIRPNLPIILATGYAELPLPEESGVPRLCKPYRLEDLISLMDEVLRRQNVKPPSSAELLEP